MTTIKDKDMLIENSIRPNEGENFFVSYSDDSKHSNRVEELKDFVLALENKIDEFTQAKGTKKLPAKAARYIKGGPNKSKRKINKPSQPELPRMLSNQSHSEEGADEFRTMKDELTDEIENIPDEIEF